jgi:hypothetical protein
MTDWTPLAAAGIGAVVGSVGTAYVNVVLSRNAELRRRRAAVVQSYLLQLQLDTESLWHRIVNLAYRGGIGAMADERYYVESSLFAFGRLVAHRLLLEVEGIYAELEGWRKGLGSEVLHRLHLIDTGMGHLTSEAEFQHYDRRALGELLLEVRDATHSLVTFREARAAVQANKGDTALQRGEAFVLALGEDDAKQLLPDFLQLLESLAMLLPEYTKITFPETPEKSRTPPSRRSSPRRCGTTTDLREEPQVSLPVVSERSEASRHQTIVIRLDVLDDLESRGHELRSDLPQFYVGVSDPDRKLLVEDDGERGLIGNTIRPGAKAQRFPVRYYRFSFE